MKYLLVIFVVALAIWIWRRNRQEEMDEIRSTRAAKAAAPAPRSGTPQAMVRCAHCGLHLPAVDAIAGPGGVYCSAAHRQAAGR